MKGRWKGLCAIWLAVLLVCEQPGIALAEEESGGDGFVSEQSQPTEEEGDVSMDEEGQPAEEEGGDDLMDEEEQPAEEEGDGSTDEEEQPAEEEGGDGSGDEEEQPTEEEGGDGSTGEESQPAEEESDNGSAEGSGGDGSTDEQGQPVALSASDALLSAQSQPVEKETGVDPLASTYTIKFPTGEGYTIYSEDLSTAVAGDVEVAEGDSYTFVVLLERGYLKSTSFAVAANGTVLANQGAEWEDYTCTIEAVSENQEVTVTGLAPGTVAWLYIGSGQIGQDTVISTASDKEDKEVLFGTPLNGQGIVDQPGRLDGWTVWSCESGGNLSAKIKDCNADGAISKEDYEKTGTENYLLLAPVWKALFEIGVGSVTEGGSFTVSAESGETAKAYEGEKVTVLPQPETGYAMEKITVTAADSSQVPVSGNSFVMPGSSVTVNVSFAKKRFNITLPSGNGYTVAADGQGLSVEYGGSFTFTVTIGEGCTASDSFAVTADGVALTPSGVNGNVYTYTMENITASRTIAVTGVTDPTAGGDASDRTVSQSGARQLKKGVAYVLGEGTWKIAGDDTVYQGQNTFYVLADGEYVFEKQ